MLSKIIDPIVQPVVLLGLTLLALLTLPLACSRQERSARVERQQLDFPAPRFPRYVVTADKERMLNGARLAVRQSTGRSPLGKIQSGEEVYVLINWAQDREVLEAIKTAWAERSISAKWFGYWDVLGLTEQQYAEKIKSGTVKGNEAWKELGNFEQKYRVFFPEEIRRQFGNSVSDFLVYPSVAAYLDQHPEIKKFYAGPGGGVFWIEGIGPKHANKYMGNWIYTRPVDLLSKSVEFPSDVWNLADEKIIKPLTYVSEVILTDPEGTHLEFLLTEEQSKKWAEHAGTANHLYVYPSPANSTLKKGGVIRAHGNHTGIYPTMTVYLDEFGVAERVEGGGKVGELFKLLVNHPKLRNVKFPKAPAPGYWYVMQDGFATNPKFVRSIPAYLEGEPWMANLSERNRAGIQHLAFAYDSADPEDLAYAKKEGVPLGNGEHTAHMHLYFPTVRWKLRDTGEWMTVADKGNTKIFEDSEMRALASKYGDPELVFRYEWIPSIPGINVPGDYQSYSRDPWSWIVEEWKSITSGQYEYFVEDYKLEPVGVSRAGLDSSNRD